MSILRITTAQAKLHWENQAKNLKHISQLLKTVKPNHTDIIVLPEMFNTGFSMNAKTLAEKPGGISMQWMHEIAEEKNAVVCGSLIIEENGKFFNRFIWMTPGGAHAHYDKRHLFTMAGEHQSFAAGNKKLILLYKGWRISAYICYDLRFPVWMRNQHDYDCAIVVANWPEKRSFAWKQLLLARAIENQAFVVGLNRVGKDGNRISYSGDSMVLDPFGKKISKTKAGVEQVETVHLDFDVLEEARHLFPVADDADHFTIQL
jgi:predicted amidohydrolase